MLNILNIFNIKFEKKMGLKFMPVLMLFFVVCKLHAQVISDDEPELLEKQLPLIIPTETEINTYCDSVKNLQNYTVICGYVNSIYHEPADNVSITAVVNGNIILNTTTNSQGMFQIPLKNISVDEINLQIVATEYYNFDTIIKGRDIKDNPIFLAIKPRYKLLVRGRTISGTLPLEDVDINIVHASDTFRTKTLGCYTDSENYWNCLYLGMFKQSIIFDNPADSLFIKVSKPGYNDENISMTCSQYDGSIIPIRLKYTDQLPKLLQHNITLKLAFPFFSYWNAGINYSYTLKIKNFNRLGIGFEGMMLISEYTTRHPTFRDVASLPDTAYQMASFDTSYTSLFVGPQVFLWLSNPMKRSFAIYGGISTPFSISQSKIFFHPFIGSRFFIDYNKAVIVELKYLTYELDVTHYKFDPYGKATSNTINTTYNKFLINIGLQMCF